LKLLKGKFKTSAQGLSHARGGLDHVCNFWWFGFYIKAWQVWFLPFRFAWYMASSSRRNKLS